MKMRTIWTLPLMSFKARVQYTKDELARLVSRRLPLRVRYWTSVIAMGYATRDSKNIPATPLDEIMKHLERPKGIY